MEERSLCIRDPKSWELLRKVRFDRLIEKRLGPERARLIVQIPAKLNKFSTNFPDAYPPRMAYKTFCLDIRYNRVRS